MHGLQLTSSFAQASAKTHLGIPSFSCLQALPLAFISQTNTNYPMTMRFDPNTRIIDLTVGELVDIIRNAVDDQPKQAPEPVVPRRYDYGIAGIARIFGCSMTTANRIKASGRINDAIKQNGRLIVVDADLALELFNNTK